mgnify:FL=1
MIKILLPALGFIALSLSGIAQTLKIPENIELTALVTSGQPISSPQADTITNPMQLFSPSDQFVYTLNMQLPDTINVQVIHVSLGVNSASDIASADFTFDAANPDYTRTGHQLSLVLGTFAHYPQITSSISLEDANGNVSETITTTSNF